MTRPEAFAALASMAVSIDEPTEADAIARLRERVAAGPSELRDALAELGARALLQAREDRAVR
jgi:hypothetical protein